jgi:uncharacterized membrane protein
VIEIDTPRRPVGLAIFFIIVGLIGWVAAFTLTVEKIDLLMDPTASSGCDFSILVQCKTNLLSWQGALLGFPNPLIGVGAWAAPVAVGTALLAGARFDRWFWLAFNGGVVAALSFVIWLISQSVFVLGTLCPWCMVTWSATIPLFWVLTLYNLREGHFTANTRARAVGETLLGWVPAITIGCYLIVALIAQLRLDVTSYL